jgi:uncharacterized membrane protein YoaK (UPF0700 family)
MQWRQISREVGRFILSIPALIGSVLPVFKACPPCPVCMPIYAGILSLLGLELAEYGHFVVPVMLFSMLVTLASLAYQAYRIHHKPWAFLIAFTSCSAILIFKFGFDFLPPVYCGMAGMVTALVMNRRFVKRVGSCCGAHAH